MAAIDVKLTDPKKFSNWKNGSECGHARSSFKVVKICWLEVQMVNDLVSVVAGPVGFTHECIEVKYECTECGATGYFTAELLGISEGKGKRFSCGRYEANTQVVDGREVEPESMTVEDVETKFNKMGEDYNLFTNNCKHWAKSFWSMLD